MLTTVTSPGVDPFTGQPLTTSVSYKDAHNHIVLITVGGNTTAEFISGRVNNQNRVILGDLAGPGTPDGEGQDLFAIYVSQSDSRSFISVTEINPTNGALLPFNSNSGTFRVRNAVNGRTTTVTADGPGQIILGARTKDIGPQMNEEDIAIISRGSVGAIGVRPDLGPRITAGFEVAAGMDFGKFLFGGTILGQMTVPGTIGTIYAGNVWTGDARGVSVGSTEINSRGRKVPNFNIGGNLHSLLVGGSVGTNDDAALERPTFVTGFQAQVGGIVGELNTRGDWVGGVNVLHGRAATQFGSTIEEVEGRNAASDVPTDASGWANGFLEGNGVVFNDSFGTPEVLPSFVGRRGHSSVTVTGQLVADNTTQDRVDYYAMPMLAGQDLTIQLTEIGAPPGLSIINVGVFDPDGRLILTDYANVDITQVTGQPVHFTADRPGLYRIAVAGFGDGDFDGTPGLFRGNVGTVPYTLSVQGGGDLGLGAVVASQNLTDGQNFGFGFSVENGDMGALQAGGTIFSLTDDTVDVRVKNLRSIEGNELGVLRNNAIGLGPTLNVPKGNVGLVRATGGVLDLNNATLLPVPVGGDYQIVQSSSTMLVTLVANRGIGMIKAGDFATRSPSVISVNADELRDDGVIDLIDCAGDFGTLIGGGPAITTGPGGNVRYINVGGATFRDAFFGGGAQEATTSNPGEEVHLTDDSGTGIEIEPFPVIPNPLFVPGGTNPAVIGPSVSVLGYGIRGSGGLAIINITTNGSVRVGAGGRRGSRSHAEIGVINTTGTGNPVVQSTNTAGLLVFQQPTTGTAAVTLDVLMDGSATLDVFKVTGSNFTKVVNETAGEIVNVDATTQVPNGTIGELRATNIGVAVNHTGAAVNGLQTISNVYPFLQQHNGVVSGTIIGVEASAAVGNLNVTGTIGGLAANSGGRHTTGTFEGIVGPIVASQDITSVNIGDGILPSGSGNLSKAGLYAGRIGTVKNQGLGSDIRGDIVATTSIDRVSLSDGAIIGNKILVIANLPGARRFATTRGFTDTLPDTTTSPVFEIGSISASGQGGIIGSEIGAADIGDISTSGFGVLNSLIADLGDGTINSITAGGYGIRQTTADGGALLNSVKATARGPSVSVKSYSPSVRVSETRDIDPFFDQAPNAETDLHVFLGTSSRKPTAKGITDTGVIADSTFTANRNAGTIFAATIRGVTQFNIANQISSIETRGVINGLLVTTGRLKSYFSGGDSIGINLQVAGTLDKAHIVGAMDETSIVKSQGGSARILEFIVDGSLDGQLISADNIHLLAIGKDLGPTGLVKARSLDIQRIHGGVFGTIQIG